MRGLSVLCLIFISSLIHAGEVKFTSVGYERGVYRLHLRIQLDAAQEEILRMVTDYDQLHRFSDVFTHTARIDALAEGDIRRRLEARSCILFFCFEATIVEDVWESGDGRIYTTIIPEHSDFKYGKTEWHVKAIGRDHSEIEFRGDIQPDFWIPKVIGPLILQHKMTQEARETILNLERLAGNE